MKKSLRSPDFLLPVILCLAFIFGVFVVQDYGLSWDEPSIRRYVTYALDAYQYLLHPQDLPAFDDKLSLYGPAFFLMTAQLARGINALAPSWTSIDAWHFIYFASFLAGVYFFYLLSRRWLSAWAAFVAALLLLSQPLLWGHAFMNPKDTPFMTFFTATIYLGFGMTDAPARSSRQALLIFFAGILLGLTVSFRVIGPLAGVFVLIYALFKERRLALYLLVPYFLLAAISAYLTWPFLWGAPLANYVKSLATMSDFPFKLKILFLGSLYKAEDLPLRYFPTLLAYQLTGTTLVLIAAGIAAYFKRLLKEKIFEFGLLFVGWFIFPAAYVIVSGSTLYDNGRQLIFILPPLFIFAGMGIDLLFDWVKSAPLKIALAAVALLPGLYACIHLHPYQYVYYNQLAGGIGGAYRKFDLDYWGISLKETAEYLNANALQNALVLVAGPRQLVEPYARPDLQLLRQMDMKDRDLSAGEYYVIYLTRTNEDEGRCLDAETVYVVERDGGVLSYVKRVKPGQTCE